MRLAIISLLVWGWLFVACGQEMSKPSKSVFHLKLGAGAAWQTVRDQAMSPLLYDGLQLALQGGFDLRGARSLYRVDGLFWVGETEAERSGRTTENYSYAVNSSYLRRVSREEKKWAWQVGGAITNWGSFRDHQSLINSDFFYDLFFSVGATAALQHQFRFFRREWHVEWQLIVPALTFGLRPNYIGLDAAPPGEGSFETFTEAALTSFNGLQNVKSRFELAYPLRNGNRLGLMYYWDFFNTSIGPHPARQSMQSLQFNLHFSMSK